MARAIRGSDRNLADYLAHCAVSARGLVDDTSDHVFFSGGPHPGPFSNGAIRRGPGGAAGELIERADAFFAPLRRPYLFWVRDHLDGDLAAALLDRDFTLREPVDGLSGVAVDRRPDAYEIPTGMTLRMIDDEQGYLDYQDVIAEVWQMAGAPRSVVDSVLFPLDSARHESMSVVVLYEGERALAASANFVSGGCGGMQWTGTRQEAAGRGLGRIVCAAAWASAFDRGEDLVVGQASAIGTPVWLGMGFREVTRYRRFMSPPPARRRSL